MKFFSLLFSLLFLLTIISKAQPCSSANVFNNWNFGVNASVSFNSGVPVVTTGSAMNSSNGGSSSISNGSGKLLFYTDGATIWDSTNAVMSNGSGLSGNPSFSQSAIITSDPGNPSHYYVFTNGNSGLKYSVVDMSANGGLGSVISKDNTLFSPTSQKLAGTGDDHGNVWMVTHDTNNNFEAFKVSSSGITGPVTSTIGSNYGGSPPGYLKFSADGTKAAVGFTIGASSFTEVFDFNKTTGQFSNPVQLSISAYGVEFSPDDSKLYTSSVGSGINQFDLSAGSAAAIQLSMRKLDDPALNGSGTYYNALQLGPDGNIYVADGKLAGGYLGVIANPNSAAATYAHKAIDLGTGYFTADYGLPNVVSNYSIPTNYTYADTCFSLPTRFSGTGDGDPALWTWNFGDPASGVNNTGTGANPTHIFSTANQSYSVTLTVPGACGGTATKLITINANPTVDIKDTLLCIVPYTLDAGSHPGASYLWSDGETTQSISIRNAGRYWVKVTQNGCSASDTARISVWGQGNHGDYQWYFGNHVGINFSTDPPQTIGGSALSATGGSSSISDPTGHILFYTDGQTVYDNTNTVMANGSGLLGSPASSQPALIVPDPRANNLYYVFTSNPASGVSYSVVDLSYNGGKGKVTQLNVPLFSPTTGSLAGLSDSAGGFWTAVYNPAANNFLAYKINNTGLVTTPVTSPSGVAVTSPYGGALKFSKDGTKAVMALDGQNLVEVYDFNKVTGVFSNPVKITTATSPSGVEFAPDDSKLYVSTDGNHQLLQYDLDAGSEANIDSSHYVVSSNPSVSYDNMQLGPDGRIYVALGNSGSIGIINDPTQSTSSSEYTQSTGVLTNAGLPNLISNYFTTSSWGILYADTCFGMTTLFQGSAPDSVRSWHWDFGDGGTANTQSASHIFSTPGAHTVSLRVIYHCGDTTMTTNVKITQAPVVNLGSNPTLCGASSYLLDAGNNSPDETYAWSTGETTQKITVTTGGTYSVSATIGQCSTSGSITVTFANNPPAPDLGPDNILCSGNVATLDATSTAAGVSYTWYDGATGTPTHNISATGTYWVDVTLGTCKLRDSVNYTFIPAPLVNLGPDNDGKCLGQDTTIHAGNPGYTYLWSTSGTDENIKVSSTGWYWVDVYQGLCKVRDSIHFTFSSGPLVSLPPEIIFCPDDVPSIKLFGGTATSYKWLPGLETTDSLTVTQEGIYTLTAYNGNCPTTVSTHVFKVCQPALFVPSAFSPNDDGRNDIFQIFGENIVQYELRIFDRWGELIFVSDDMSKSWDGVYRGKIVEEGVYVWKVEYSGKTKNSIAKYVKEGDVTVIK